MQLPLYQVVYNEIVQRIADGRYAPGTMLPSEFDLGTELGVSQGTARKALTELEKKRIVERRQGRGTFVTLRTPENSLFGFFLLQDKGGAPVKPELMSEDIRRRSATKHETATLHGAPSSVFEIARVRHFKGKPFIRETSVVPVALFPGLPERAPLPNTLYVLFQQAYARIIIAAQDDLRGGLVDEATAALLNCAAGTPALISERKSMDLLDQVIELRTSVILTQDMCYSVRLD